MNDLISRTELLKHSHRVTEYDEAGFSMEYNAVPTEEIKNAPAVDAVEILRCKDCKRWGTGVAGETDFVKCCEFGKYMIGANGYCLYGERK